MPHHRLAGRRCAVVAAVGAVGISLVACALKVSGLGDPGAIGATDAMEDGPSMIDGGGDVVAVIDASDAAPWEGGSPCTGDAGPESVQVGSYCIDKTEVTAAQYAGFLAAVEAGAPLPLPAACAGKTSFTPGAPLAQGDYPVASVDWCDAFAFCVWAGKRLCGRIGGGASAWTEVADSGASQWYRACSFEGLRPYPYGAAYQARACNGADNGIGTTWSAGVNSCAGGFPGVYDLSGNVWEWEDSCAGAASTDPCRVRGGGYKDTRDLLRCDYAYPFSRASVDPTLGFRCCSAP